MKSDIVSTKFPSRFSIRSINDGDQENRNLSEVIASSHDFINVTIVNNQRVTSTDHFQVITYLLAHLFVFSKELEKNWKKALIFSALKIS